MDPALRILDANLNRAREGLRTLEEYARFALNDESAQRACRDIRHRLEDVLKGLGPLQPELLKARDVGADVGAASTPDARRSSLADIALAGAKRAQEALRVIEEAAALYSPEAARAAALARFDLYRLEQTLFADAPPRAREVLAREPVMVIITRKLCHRTWRTAVDELLAAGCRVFQLREKKLTTQEFVAYTREFTKRVRPAGGLVIVNDRADVAFAAEADGVHLGQEDLNPGVARRMLGRAAIIGVSVHNPLEAREAETAGADYVGLGAMYATRTKNEARLAGPHLLKEVLPNTGLAVFAIGGITDENVPELGFLGARHVAVCSAIIRSPEPGSVYRKISAALRQSGKPSEAVIAQPLGLTPNPVDSRLEPTKVEHPGN